MALKRLNHHKRRRSSGFFAVATLSVSLMAMSLAMGQEKAQFFGTQEDGYGRLILSFPDRETLPTHTVRASNSILSIEFENEIAISLPDISSTMPDYLAVARTDSDGKGLRIGMRANFNFHATDAGDKLFIDLLPDDWQGMPPQLPQDVLDEMAERAERQALEADQARKARVVAEQNPQVAVRIGRNPTFLRLQFDWTIPTGGDFDLRRQDGRVEFEWPVTVDLRDLRLDLPEEIIDIKNSVSPDGSAIDIKLAKGVTPRFYANSPSQYVLDIDLEGVELPALTAQSLLEADEHGMDAPEAMDETGQAPHSLDTLAAEAPPSITPFVTMVGNTARVVFPFEQETPAAVFQRGESVWLIFDSQSRVAQPGDADQLDAISTEFHAASMEDSTQIVRIDLTKERLATLGSEGLTWVLSLGDVVVAPSEPLDLHRRRNMQGTFEMVANMIRPARVHDFRDPLVGDLLKVVTAYPPSRGLTRQLDYVDFSALNSVHGLVIRPKADDLDVAIENALAVVSLAEGLTVSAIDAPRVGFASAEPVPRVSYVDLKVLTQTDPDEFSEQRDALEATAAASQGPARDQARLQLANYFLANRLGLETLGVLDVAQSTLRDPDLTHKIELTRAIANVVSGRPETALETLNSNAFEHDIDAMFWRSIARNEVNDFAGARADATQAYSIADSYPSWARELFLLSAARSALEEQNVEQADKILSDIDFAALNDAQIAEFTLLSARRAEAQGNLQAAIDGYGEVIRADDRPTRAEAVYRTLKILDRQGRLDVVRAAQTLSAEALLWRGDALEAKMQGMLADLYFRNSEYRQGFEAVKAALDSDPDSRQVQLLADRAQDRFVDLFLHGLADSIGPVEALGIYYDFRHLTPPGAQGDEMIRNLARRLVRASLLPQAAELLHYQIDNRLRGVSRTQVATDLAVIYLAEHEPSKALQVLNESSLPDLPGSLTRQRRVIEARALLDGGRDQLALDLLRDLDGQDVEIMQIDAHWKARRYDQAGRAIEALYAETPANMLTKPARLNIVQAGVGYVLSGDEAGLARLRAKFSDAMSSSPEWPLFDYITGPIEADSMEFKQVAAQIAARDSLEAFLAAYRETYSAPDSMVPEAPMAKPSDVAAIADEPAAT